MSSYLDSLGAGVLNEDVIETRHGRILSIVNSLHSYSASSTAALGEGMLANLLLSCGSLNSSYQDVNLNKDGEKKKPIFKRIDRKSSFPNTSLVGLKILSSTLNNLNSNSSLHLPLPIATDIVRAIKDEAKCLKPISLFSEWCDSKKEAQIPILGSWCSATSSYNDKHPSKALLTGMGGSSYYWRSNQAIEGPHKWNARLEIPRTQSNLISTIKIGWIKEHSPSKIDISIDNKKVIEVDKETLDACSLMDNPVFQYNFQGDPIPASTLSFELWPALGASGHVSLQEVQLLSHLSPSQDMREILDQLHTWLANVFTHSLSSESPYYSLSGEVFECMLKLIMIDGSLAATLQFIHTLIENQNATSSLRLSPEALNNLNTLLTSTCPLLVSHGIYLETWIAEMSSNLINLNYDVVVVTGNGNQALNVNGVLSKSFECVMKNNSDGSGNHTEENKEGEGVTSLRRGDHRINSRSIMSRTLTEDSEVSDPGFIDNDIPRTRLSQGGPGRLGTFRREDDGPRRTNAESSFIDFLLHQAGRGVADGEGNEDGEDDNDGEEIIHDGEEEEEEEEDEDISEPRVLPNTSWATNLTTPAAVNRLGGTGFTFGTTGGGGGGEEEGGQSEGNDLAPAPIRSFRFTPSTPMREGGPTPTPSTTTPAVTQRESMTRQLSQIMSALTTSHSIGGAPELRNSESQILNNRERLSEILNTVLSTDSLGTTPLPPIAPFNLPEVSDMRIPSIPSLFNSSETISLTSTLPASTLVPTTISIVSTTATASESKGDEGDTREGGTSTGRESSAEESKGEEKDDNEKKEEKVDETVVTKKSKVMIYTQSAFRQSEAITNPDMISNLHASLNGKNKIAFVFVCSTNDDILNAEDIVTVLSEEKLNNKVCFLMGDTRSDSLNCSVFGYIDMHSTAASKVGEMIDTFIEGSKNSPLFSCTVKNVPYILFSFLSDLANRHLKEISNGNNNSTQLILPEAKNVNLNRSKLFKKGDVVDVEKKEEEVNGKKVWERAIIMEIKDDKYLIHFLNDPSSIDEWIKINDNRVFMCSSQLGNSFSSPYEEFIVQTKLKKDKLQEEERKKESSLPVLPFSIQINSKTFSFIVKLLDIFKGHKENKESQEQESFISLLNIMSLNLNRISYQKEENSIKIDEKAVEDLRITLEFILQRDEGEADYSSEIFESALNATQSGFDILYATPSSVCALIGSLVQVISTSKKVSRSKVNLLTRILEQLTFKKKDDELRNLLQQTCSMNSISLISTLMEFSFTLSKLNFEVNAFDVFSDLSDLQKAVLLLIKRYQFLFIEFAEDEGKSLYKYTEEVCNVIDKLCKYANSKLTEKDRQNEFFAFDKLKHSLVSIIIPSLLSTLHSQALASSTPNLSLAMLPLLLPLIQNVVESVSLLVYPDFIKVYDKKIVDYESHVIFMRAAKEFQPSQAKTTIKNDEREKEYIWECELEHGEWRPYPSSLNVHLNRCFRENRPRHSSVSFATPRGPYRINVVEMTQTNELTGTQRVVRKRLANGELASTVTAEVKPEFVSAPVLDLPWFVSLLRSASTVVGSYCSRLVTSIEVVAEEEEISPFLFSFLFQAGFSTPPSTKPLRYSETEYPPSIQELKGNDEEEETKQFVSSLTSESSINAIELVKWLTKSYPSADFLKTSTNFSLDHPCLAAFILHGGLVNEAKAVLKTLTSNNVPPTPSYEMLLMWKNVLKIRSHVRSLKQLYAIKENDEREEKEREKIDRKDKPLSPQLITSIPLNPPELARTVSNETTTGGGSAKVVKRWIRPRVIRPNNLTFDEAVQDVKERVLFLLNLSSSLNLFFGEDDDDAIPTTIPLLRATSSMTHEDRWGNGSTLNSRSLFETPPSLTTQEESDEEKESTIIHNMESTKCKVALHGCVSYIIKGGFAPPDVMEAVISRRTFRARYRASGFNFLNSFLLKVPLFAAKTDALKSLEFSLKGNRELTADPSDTCHPTLIHPLLYIEGVCKIDREAVREAFQTLWTTALTLSAGDQGIGVLSCGSWLYECDMLSENKDVKHLASSGLIRIIRSKIKLSNDSSFVSLGSIHGLTVPPIPRGFLVSSLQNGLISKFSMLKYVEIVAPISKIITKEWHNEANDKAERKEILDFILKEITKKIEIDSSGHKSSAKKIESDLYSSASTKSEYIDRTTLIDRINHAFSNDSDYCHDSNAALQNIISVLGKYKDVKDIKALSNLVSVEECMYLYDLLSNSSAINDAKGKKEKRKVPSKIHTQGSLYLSACYNESLQRNFFWNLFQVIISLLINGSKDRIRLYFQSITKSLLSLATNQEQESEFKAAVSLLEDSLTILSLDRDFGDKSAVPHVLGDAFQSVRRDLINSVDVFELSVSLADMCHKRNMIADGSADEINPTEEKQVTDISRLEAFVYERLLFLFMMSGHKEGRSAIFSPSLMKALFSFLSSGSHRVQRVVLRIFRNVLPFVTPKEVQEVMEEESSEILAFLMQQIASSCLKSTGHVVKDNEKAKPSASVSVVSSPTKAKTPLPITANKACGTCTYLNPNSATECSTCLTPFPRESLVEETPSTTSATHIAPTEDITLSTHWQCEICTFLNESTNNYCSVCNNAAPEKEQEEEEEEEVEKVAAEKGEDNSKKFVNLRNIGSIADNSKGDNMFQSGYINMCISSECVSLIRFLYSYHDWANAISDMLAKNIKEIVNLNLESSEIAYMQEIMPALALCCASFYVLGGEVDFMRVGGRVKLNISSSTGVVVQYSPGNKKCKVSFGDGECSEIEVFDCVPIPEVGAKSNLINLSDSKNEQIIKVIISLLTPLDSRPKDNISSTSLVFNDLRMWRSQLQNAVLGAINVMVQNESNSLALLSSDPSVIVDRLMLLGLQPIPLKSFVPQSSLSCRSSFLQSLLTDVGNKIAHIGGIKLKEKEEDDKSKQKTKAKEVIAPKILARNKLAEQLVSMLSMDFKMCVKALEMAQDSMDRAVDMLLNGQVEAFMKGSSNEGMTDTRWVKSQEAATITNMPPKLCYRALEMMDDDITKAVSWLFDFGHSYRDSFKTETGPSGSGDVPTSTILTNEALIQDMDEKDVLLSDNSIASPLSDKTTSSTSNSDEKYLLITSVRIDPASISELKLGSIVTLSENLSDEKVQEYLGFPGSNLGVLSSLYKDEITGEIMFTIRQIDTQSCLVTSTPPTSIKYLMIPIDLFGHSLISNENVFPAYLESELQLCTHLSRNAIVSILAHWPSTVPLSSLGNIKQLVRLVKFIAAIELFSLQRGEGSKENESKDVLSFNVQALTKVMVNLLKKEAEDYTSFEPYDNEESLSASSSLEVTVTEVKKVEETKLLEVEPLKVIVEETAEERELREALELSMMDDGDEEEEEKVLPSGSKEEKPSEEVKPTDTKVEETKEETKEDVKLLSSVPSLDDGKASDYSLSKVLVNECVNNFVETTDQGDTKELIVKESLHPHFNGCIYGGLIEFEGAKALRVTFDIRSALSSQSALQFFKDSNWKAGGTALHTFTSANVAPWRSLVIHGDKFSFAFRSNEREGGGGKWGYKFEVAPIRGLQWLCEKEVVSDSSLEWACWVLQFLLNEGQDMKAVGAVHNVKVYDALVSYLRTPGAPYKHKIISLLTQLLLSPSLFPRDSLPKLDKIRGLEKCVLELCEKRLTVEEEEGRERRSKIISSNIQSIIEVLVASKMFAASTRSNANNSENVLFSNLLEDIVLVVKMSKIFDYEIGANTNAEIEKECEYIYKKTLLYEKSRVLISSSHPYEAVSTNGKVSFPLTSTITVILDVRTKFSNGTSLSLDYLDAATNSAIKIDINSESLRSKVFVYEINSNALTWKFNVSSGNSSSAFGFNAVIIGNIKNVTKLTDIEEEAENVKLKAFTSNIPNKQLIKEIDLSLVGLVNKAIDSGLIWPAGKGSETISLQIFLPLSKQDLISFPSLEGVSESILLSRFSLLLLWNKLMSRCLPLFHFTQEIREWSLSHKVKSKSHLTFQDIKLKLLQTGISETNARGGLAITLNRHKSMSSKEKGGRDLKDITSSECLFVQAYKQLHLQPPARLRGVDRVFNVKFVNEDAADAGGPYREAISEMVEDLFSKHFGLFIPCPNSVHRQGHNLDSFVPNPGATAPEHVSMFEFVGKLIGIAIRTKNPLPFQLPSIIWKPLIGENPTLNDIRDVDVISSQNLQTLREVHEEGINNELEFGSVYRNLFWSTHGSDGREVEVVKEGKEKRVTFQNRLDYCLAVEDFRLNESSFAVSAMRRGLETIIPISLLNIFTWREVENMICGNVEIDIDVLIANTEYRGFRVSDPTIVHFWTVMKSFTNEQRSQFIRFSWGRSRLPRGVWDNHFTICKKPGDINLLPIAHTCFFQIELPPYPTEEMMRMKLLNCIQFGLGAMLLF